LAEDREMQQRNQSVERNLAQMVREAEQRTEAIVRGLRMTGAKRKHAERIIRKVGRRRTWLGTYKHNAVQRRFLRLMILVALAAHPADHRLAVQIARYYSDNYAFEWSRFEPFNRMKSAARDMILQGADSEFGETPQSGHLAYVLAHHRELGIENISRYSELTTRNLALERENFFRDLAEERRKELELDVHMGEALRAVGDSA
jgi:hypothetical protein